MSPPAIARLLTPVAEIQVVETGAPPAPEKRAITRFSSTRLRIDGLELFGRHGMHEEERRLGQKFLFDVVADLRGASAHDDDALAASVGYDQLIDAVAEFSGGQVFFTLESLSCRLAEHLFDRFPVLDKLMVRVKKLSPPIAATLAGVSVEITAERGAA